MPPIPTDGSLDSTIALLADGYTFVTKRARRLDSDIFRTRLMLREAYCAVGAEAARVFYEPGRFTRRGALPPTTLRLLLDEGSVAMLDGEAHRWRKGMWMSLMRPEHLDRLVSQFAAEWRAQVPAWARRRELVLHEAAQEVLCRAVCAWAGIPLSEAEGRDRTREFAAMIAGAGAVGPRMWKGMLLRRRTERWARDIIRRIRAGTLVPPEGSAALVIATHRDLDGALLDPESAAVELINVLRPTVAVARFVTFAAHALHEFPECRSPLQTIGEPYLEWFVQEVRRFYPFFPMVGGRARAPFEWRGHRFEEGAWMLLDLYGTNHDPRSWDQPDAFRPERFREWDGSAFDFVPQGGGDFHENHRCAGEWIAITLTKEAVRLLTREMRYELPPQDLRIDLGRMPAIPRSGVVIAGVRPAS